MSSSADGGSEAGSRSESEDSELEAKLENWEVGQLSCTSNLDPAKYPHLGLDPTQ